MNKAFTRKHFIIARIIILILILFSTLRVAKAQEFQPSWFTVTLDNECTGKATIKFPFLRDDDTWQDAVLQYKIGSGSWEIIAWLDDHENLDGCPSGVGIVDEYDGQWASFWGV